MIRIRVAGGDVRELAEGEFVEFCDKEGRVASVYYYSRRHGIIRHINPISTKERAARYKKAFPAVQYTR